MTEKLSTRRRLSHDETAQIQPGCQLFDFLEHHSSDALAPEIPSHNDVVDLNGIRQELEPGYRNKLADKLSEQTACRNLPFILFRKELPHRLVVARFDGPDEELLTSHDPLPRLHFDTLITLWGDTNNFLTKEWPHVDFGWAIPPNNTRES